MLRMIDLKNASRDDLIRLIVSQRETIARQERVIAAQQGRMLIPVGEHRHMLAARSSFTHRPPPPRQIVQEGARLGDPQRAERRVASEDEQIGIPRDEVVGAVSGFVVSGEKA